MRFWSFVFLWLAVYPWAVFGQQRSETANDQIWFGTLDVKVAKLRLEIRVSKPAADAPFQGSMSSLDQGNAQLQLDHFETADGEMRFEIKQVQAAFVGKLNVDGTAAIGTFAQFGTSYPMTFERKTVSSVPLHKETWHGSMEAGVRKFEFQIRVFADAQGVRSAVLDSFSENAFALPIELDESSGFNFSMPSTNANYRGKIADDGKSICGTWFQAGQEFDLNFENQPIAATRFPKRNRPQTPKPPFEYVVEEMRVDSQLDPHLSLAGTLTIPAGDGPFPAAILISGSGPQDRDCELFGHKSFLIIADHFARNSIAVLRYDERGVGQSKGDFSAATSVELAQDVESLLDWLKKHPKIDPARLALIGHSEGGIIAPMIAARRGDLDRLILLAAPTVPGSAIVLNQTRKIAQVAGAADSDLDAQQKLLERVIAHVQGKKLTGDDLDTIIAQVHADLPAAAREQFKFPDAAKARLLAFDTPWFKYFLHYDPAPALRQVSIPVLMVFGEKDLQVDPDLNAAIAEKIISQNPQRQLKIVRFPKLNHLFQTSDTGSPSEYDLIEESFNAAVLDNMVQWISPAHKK